MSTAVDLENLQLEVAACRRCPRLVAWREQVARRRSPGSPTRSTGAGRSRASATRRPRSSSVGLAPAAHGGNRTGRIFTGDRSGDFLFAALHRAGFANQPTSTHATTACAHRRYITAAVRCAPPANKPTPEERDTCLPFLVRELALLPTLA